MLLNFAAIITVLIIVLAIGVFIGRTLTMNSGSSVPDITPTIKPGDNSNSFVLPSGMPTSTPTIRPNVNATSTPSASPTATATPAPTSSPTPTPMPSPTPTPTPEPSYYPTAPPLEATPTPTPSPVDIAPDAPFYENITPLKDGDFVPPVSDYNSFTDNGPIYIDIHQSYMGSDYAYPGDTIGVKLRLYNTGPAIDTVSRVTLNLSRMITPNVWLDDVINEQYYTKITMSNQGSMYKNFSYTVPMDNSIKGTYKIRIRFYVNGQLNAEAIKAFNIL